MTDLSTAIVEVLRSLPAGRVATYGQVAAMAGRPGAARQVARLLHSSASRLDLPWHRVVGAEGRIRLPEGHGMEVQIGLLEAEGVEVSAGTVNLGLFGLDS